MPIEHESEVRRDGIQAGHRLQAALGDAVDVRDNVIGEHRSYFLVGHVATNRVSVGRLRELLGRDLDAATRSVDRRKTVDALSPARQLPDEDRTTFDVEGVSGRVDFEPEERLPID